VDLFSAVVVVVVVVKIQKLEKRHVLKDRYKDRKDFQGTD
jgi:hypothetical protein